VDRRGCHFHGVSLIRVSESVRSVCPRNPCPRNPTKPKLDEDDIRSVDSDTSLAALRAVGSDQILKLAQAKPSGERHFKPNTDGYFLPETVSAIFAAGRQAHVPLMAGWNQEARHAFVSVHLDNPHPRCRLFRGTVWLPLGFIVELDFHLRGSPLTRLRNPTNSPEVSWTDRSCTFTGVSRTGVSESASSVCPRNFTKL
jgi:Carboxylesterase family